LNDRYDRLGRTYTATRREDARLAAAIGEALGDARTVLNVGAGTGSYEPRDRDVTAVEPSPVMRAQRPAHAPAAIDAHAEALPFADGEFDATMAVLSDHHWEDRAGGLRELRRVASRRAVVFTWDQAYVDAFWLTRDYLPGFRRLPGMPLEEVAEHLGATRIQPVPLAHDWGDGFLMAFWRRPEAYLDATVRDGISCFGLLPDSEVAEFEAALRGDLSSGAWARRNEALLDLEELDLGLRLVIAEYA
jgi:SAM-dependent methyltransferase